MIKIEPKIFRITSLCCLRRHFSVIILLNFIQNLDNYSFVCIYWNVYYLRIHYYFFDESYWVVLSNIKKLWRHYHSFSADIRIFSKITQKKLLFDLHNFPINTKMSHDLFQHTLNISNLFFENLAMWRQMGLNDAT